MIALKTLLILVALYLVFELGLFYYRYHYLPVLPSIDQSAKILGTGPALRYIAAGDSTAVGAGASQTDKTYPYEIFTELSKTHQIFYKNIAVGGYRTADVLEKQVDQIIAYKPDIVTISMGGNDATHLKPADEIISNYKTIIGRLEQGTSAKIYITAIPNFNGATLLPWFFVRLLEFRTKYLNPELLKLGNDRVKIVNIHGFGDYALPDHKALFSTDNFHPGDRGYENWTAAFLEKIKAP